MKALTSHQPWASLIAAGVKTIETRSWRTSYRGRIAIHAAAHRPTEGEEYGTGWWWTWDVDHGVIVEQGAPTWREFPAPLGAIVATAELVDCVPMRATTCGEPWPGPHVVVAGNSAWLWRSPESGDCTEITDQVPFGVFEPGRWAWLLDDIKPVNERCPWCWGARFACPQHGRLAICECPTVPVCRRCGGAGLCDPIPARGQQGLWELEL